MIKLMDILKEDIYGNNAIVFHRTKTSDLINKVYDEGFKPKGGDYYCKNNSTKFTEEDVKKVCNVKRKILV